MFTWNNDPADKTKNFFKTHSTKLALIAAGIATLGCVYFVGKSHGETITEVFLIAKNDVGEYQKQMVSALTTDK